MAPLDISHDAGIFHYCLSRVSAAVMRMQYAVCRGDFDMLPFCSISVAVFLVLCCVLWLSCCCVQVSYVGLISVDEVWKYYCETETGVCVSVCLSVCRMIAVGLSHRDCHT
jgi:hypothetical protein